MLKYRMYKILRFFHLISKKKYKKKTAKYTKDYKLIARSKLFDKSWYLKCNPDVKKAGFDPILHYMHYGWKEGRNPSKEFNGNEYLYNYADVRKANLNPLLHYLKYGQKEGRIKFKVVTLNLALYKKIRSVVNRGEMRKILLISHELTYTGAPLSLLQAAKVLIDNNYKVEVLSLKDGDLRKEFAQIGVHVSILSRGSTFKLLKAAVFNDLAIVNTLVPYQQYAILSQVLPTIWWVREPVEMAERNPSLLKILKNAQNIYTMSEYSQKIFSRYSNSVQIIKHGMVDAYQNVKMNQERLSFAVIGTISVRKGIDVLVNAVAMLPKKIRKKADFYVVGQNLLPEDRYNELKAKAEDLNIIFLPPIADSATMLKFYEQITCAIVPSREEPTSRVAIEAMMMGRPVIMSDHVGAKYLLNGKNGYVFASENAEELKEILKEVIQNPAKLYNMENECRNAYLNNNSMDVFATNLKNMINSVKPADKINYHKIVSQPAVAEKNKLSLSIVVPIYNALDDVKLCLDSLLTANLDKSTEIILMDDCSEDETRDYLRQFCLRHKKFKYHRNEENSGFIKNCNKGIELAGKKIVVLLNSDTKVPAGFDRRIIKCFASDVNIACASPICTNSGFFTVAETEDFDYKKIDAVAEKTANKKYPPITPEGFCIAIRKVVMEKIGKLDPIFGIGYREEDDFVLRCLLNGYKTVLINNLVVYHKRHASFSSARRLQILQNNNKIFKQRWQEQQNIIRKKMHVAKTVNTLQKKLQKAIKNSKN